jgi:hypothetical protein
MSFSFSVPAGPASEFAERADTARAAVDNDQTGSTTCIAAVEAAKAIVETLGDGHVGASISGHHPTDGTYAFPSASVSVTYSDAPVEVPIAEEAQPEAAPVADSSDDASEALAQDGPEEVAASATE